MIIVGITGTIGAGKGTVVRYLEKNGFTHFSSRDFLVRELNKRDLPINRDMMAQIANELRSTHGTSYVAESLYGQALEQGSNAIIESIRNPGEVEALKKKGHFYLIAVDADPKLRYDRIVKRASATDHVTFEKFMSDEEKEMKSDDPSKQNISKCVAMADFKLSNDTTIDDLYTQLEKFLKDIN